MNLSFRLIVAVAGLFLPALSGLSQEKPGAAAAPLDKTAPPLPRAGNYVLTQNDVIAIRVFREPELDSQCRISKDGTINFPLLGFVTIAGRTTNDAATYLAALLDKDYIVKPQVSVSVVAYVRQRYSVLGQVGSPGSYNLPEEQSLDLLSAIAAAGGFTRLANQSKIVVRRQVDGHEETFKLDSKTFMKERNAKPFLILPNDTIVVEERFF